MSLSIAVKCRFLDDLDSTANGIQVIVQLYNASEVHKLYVNQSMDLHTPVTVPVERDGEYQVSIFAIREGMGILGSTMQYTKIVKVGNEPSGNNIVSYCMMPYKAACMYLGRQGQEIVHLS